MYNQNVHKLDTSRVYNSERGQSGRWFTGLGVGFYQQFPTDVQKLDFFDGSGDSGMVSCRTREGLRVDLQFSVQYRLKRDATSLAKLFLDYGPDEAWKTFFINYVRSEVRNVISRHVVRDMWESRDELAREMDAALAAELGPRGAVVVGVQLLNVDIPLALQRAIENTTVETQRIEEAAEQLNAVRVSAETRRLEAEQAAQVLVIQALGEAYAIRRDAEAQAVALARASAAESRALQLTREVLGFNTTELLRFSWLEALAASRAKRVVLAVPQPSETWVEA
jgi:regulator of protease activity HflC (stomatin/prohibitin superfamily)